MTSSITSTITPVDVARAAGIDPNTARRYINAVYPELWERTRRRMPAEELPQLVALCQSKRKRKCRNKFNSALIENDHALAIEAGRGE